MKRVIAMAMVGTVAFVKLAGAQNEAAPAASDGTPTTVTLPAAKPQTDAAATPKAEYLKLNAYDAVHQGNELLRSGDAKDALQLYEHAETLQPKAREIAFAEGLSRYKLGEYDAAREAFQRAWLGEKDALADDALYSEGAAYHAEALAAMDQPEVAIERLENAMQRYQSVLANDPNHEAARDANYKAGAAWRQIKKQMQQQQQKNDNKDDKKKNKGDKNQDEKQNQDKNKDQDQKDKDKEQQENDKQQKQDQKNQDQQDQDKQDQQDSDQDKDQQNQDKQEKQDQSESKQEPRDQKQNEQQMQQQKVSRQQAERKLREMMQAQRQRKKDRKKKRTVVPVRPAEKDW